MTSSNPELSGSLSSLAGPHGRLRAAINLGNPVLARRSSCKGDLEGVSVALARELARRMECELDLIPFDAAGKVVAACQEGVWDIAFLAIDLQRATEIAFTDPYIVIEGVFVVAQDSPWHSIEDLDQPGVRISVGQGAAYDLFLTRTLKRAELVRVPTSAEALAYFVDHGIEAGAGVRQPAIEFAMRHPGVRVIETPFMQIRQAMALPISKTENLPALQRFLNDLIGTGFISRKFAVSEQHN